MTDRGERGDRLMVIIPDRISDFVQKGEIAARYYNPGSYFREVHLVLVNDDDPPRDAVQRLAGDAEVHVHNLPISSRLFARSLGWRPQLLRPWTDVAVDLARRIRPDLIRCHSAHLNGLAAARINEVLGTPFVVSLHTNLDVDVRGHAKFDGGWRERLALRASLAMEAAVIRQATCVVCVYEFIVPYARRRGARRIEVLYNAMNTEHLVVKRSYELSEPPRFVLPGRQFALKDPRPIVEALLEVPHATCTFIGDGPLHDETVALAARYGIADRCTFLRSVPNDELVGTLHSYDALISVNDAGGVSKVELEAALAALPIITNVHPLETSPELIGPGAIAVDGSVRSWATAMIDLLEDSALRTRLGEAGRRAALAAGADDGEQRYVELYRELVETS